MTLLTRKQFAELAAQDGPCVSLYIPLHRKWNDAEQDPVRLKTLLYRAELSLLERGVRASAVKALLEPAASIKEEEFFRREMTGSLAVFLSPGFARFHNVPELPESVSVQGKFDLRPLIARPDEDQFFHILALSINSVRLVRVEKGVARDVDLGLTPRSLEESLADRDPDEQLQAHGAMSPRQAKTAGKEGFVFHNQATGIDGRSYKKRLIQHFEEVDKGVRRALLDSESPVVLAAVDYIQALYRGANRYPHLWPKGISGNPDHRLATDLIKEATDLIGYRDRALRAAMARYETSPSGLVSREIRDILPAAYFGRVDLIFIPADIERWGFWDETNYSVAMHDRYGSGSEGLFNLAAIHTLRNKGRVFLLPSQDIPGGLSVAAIFRY